MKPRLWDDLRERIAQLEQIPVHPPGWVAAFLAIIGVRHLLELRSSGYPLYAPSAFYAHYVLAYLAPLLMLSLVLAVLSSVDMGRVLRLMLLAWGLTLLPPLVDTLVARTHEARIGYMDLGETSLLTVFARFFDPSYHLSGTTPGIRVETAVACLLGAVYTFLRAPSSRLIRSLATAFCVYLSALFFFTLPHIFLRSLRLFDPGLTLQGLLRTQGRVPRPDSLLVREDQAILLYLVPLCLLLGCLALALFRRAALVDLARSLARCEGWGWGIAGALGAYFGFRVLEGIPATAAPATFDALALAAAPFTLVLAGLGLAALTRVHLADDAGARRERGEGVACLAGAALLAASLTNGFAAFAAIALGAGLLARGVPRLLPWAVLVPQAASGIATLASFLAGYALFAGDQAVVLLPSAVYVLLFVCGALADLPRAARDRPGLASFAAVASASAPPIALAVTALALHATVSPAWIVAAVTLSGAVLIASVSMEPRLSAAVSLFGTAAILSMQLGDPAGASAWRVRALESPTYWMNRALQLQEAGDLAAAAGAAEEAIRRAPGLAEAHERLGIIRFQREDWNGAAEELKAALAHDSTNAGLHANLAGALLNAGKADEALAAAREAVRLGPDLPRALYTMALCLDATGRRDEGTGMWRRYVSVAEGIPDEAEDVKAARARLAQVP